MNGEYQRRSARVLVLDGAGRVLLLRVRLDGADAGRGHGWFVPGGGVDEGETLGEAAARELREETGLVAGPAELGEPIAYTAGRADLGWASGLFRDDFFLHRVDTHDVDVSGMEEFERGSHAGHRWWPLDELATTTETVYPFGLAALLAGVRAGTVPVQPVQLPWHH